MEKTGRAGNFQQNHSGWEKLMSKTMFPKGNQCFSYSVSPILPPCSIKQQRLPNVYEKGQDFPNMWVGKYDWGQVWEQLHHLCRHCIEWALSMTHRELLELFPSNASSTSTFGCQPQWRSLWWQEKPGFHSVWGNRAMAPSARPLIYPWAEVTRAESDIKIQFAGKCTSSCPWDTSAELLFPLLMKGSA